MLVNSSFLLSVAALASLADAAGIAEARESALQSCPEQIPSRAGCPWDFCVSSSGGLPSAVETLLYRHSALLCPPQLYWILCKYGGEVCVDTEEFGRGKLALGYDFITDSWRCLFTSH